MLKQYLSKRKKILRGIYNTYFKSLGHEYDSAEWWDKSFYTEGISDEQTLASNKNPISSRYHYCSVELQILKHIYNQDINTEGNSVLDIGSGSGHWIDFYRSLGFQKSVGIDISQFSVNHLENKYSNDPNIKIYQGKATDVIDQLNIPFNLVNAIGVMFHIVDDSEWSDTIKKVAKLIPENGLFIVGGEFGVANGINVQIDYRGQINKRLRSAAKWKKNLIKEGFSDIKIYKNYSYLWINEMQPENNILIATK